MGKKPTVLAILDGFGITEEKRGNAILSANTPNIDMMMREYPYELGRASGLAVGLPEGQMGNSEVGHLNIGAGRIVYQSLTKITKSIEDGDFFEKKELNKAIDNVKENDSSLHICGLLSDGGVHSHNKHLYALLELVKDKKIKNVYLHMFLDGRDTSPDSAVKYIEELNKQIEKIGIGQIASISGRYYAMDRDNRWERTKKAYEAMVLGIGNESNDVTNAILGSYDKKVFDEFVEPTVIKDSTETSVQVENNDSIIFFNFRPDRARQLTRAFCDKNFEGFERKKGFLNIVFVCMTEYDVNIDNKLVVFKPEKIENTLGEYISKVGYNQYHIAETEKYAHVTFFFNGGVEKPNIKEERKLISSPKVATYDLKPEMSAYEVDENLINAIKSGKYEFIVVNFANCDMVGHTGDMDAAIKAVEAVDECMGKTLEAILEVDGQMFVCADHGNAEVMINLEDNTPFTAHTTNFVPFILVNYEKNVIIREDGKLCDIAPTILEMMGLEKPEEMTGESLLIFK